MRCAMTRVLPEPAPARISSGPLLWRTASCCAGLRDESRSMVIRDLRFAIDASITNHKSPITNLLYRHALREIPRLIDVAAAAHGDVIRQQLQRNRHYDRRQHRGGGRQRDHHVV